MDYPICAKTPAIQKLHHRDIDEQAARLTGYDQSYQQISRGPFRGTFTTCDVDPELSLFFEKTNQVLYQNAMVPRDYYAIGLLMNTDRTLVLNCEPFPKGAAFILPPGSEMEGISSPDMRICIVHVSCDLLKRTLQHQYRESNLFDPDYLPYMLIQNEKETQPLFSLLEDFQTGADKAHLSLESTNQLAALKNALVETICSVFITKQDQGRTKSGITTITRHHRLFHDALDLIQDNICEELTVGKLCEELTTSRRTLEYVFKENIKMSPAKYIRAFRLNNIRREILLMEPDTLGDIAARWGIWHLGRFARDYYQLFGELPSTTKGGVYRR
ncbi:MAG: helix-turn-helix domain-containing protein [Gammaproteobacteria bacterium]|nr:helix-turn-helix domain-containing protein [Gammaproteobacteria bacterium]MDE0283848.1 helix-turn-helix domain-containing protein [Gammaproteobacteria bacterium]